MTEAERQHRFHIILAFGLVYLFWGSTYLAIRITVQHIPPGIVCAVRFLIAGSLMLLYCSVKGRQIRVGARDLVKLAVVGILLLTGGNLTLAWAEQYVPSGLAALIVAVTPIWFLIINALLMHGDRISSRGLAGIGLGIAGAALLLWPDLRRSGRMGHKELFASLSLLGGSFSWAFGSVLSKKWDHGGDPFVNTGWQMTFAGLASLIIAFAAGEQHRAQWNTRGLAAIGYLIVFGSWVGYTAYIYLLQNAPTAKVSTYAYVNPVVAVFLGWAILRERVDAYILGGSAIIIAAVVLVTSAKVKDGSSTTSEPRLSAAEAATD